MSHFAKVESGVVTQVIVADQDVIDSGAMGDPSAWTKTSYNTHGNVHYGPDGAPDNGIALRGNYAGVGHIYDSVNDVFYVPQPHASWALDTNTWTWLSPTPYPRDGGVYLWDESTLAWVKM